MKPGDQVVTPKHQVGTIVELRPPHTDWAGHTRYHRQLAILTIAGKRAVWYVHLLKPYHPNTNTKEGAP